MRSRPKKRSKELRESAPEGARASEFDHPFEMMAAVCRELRPGGRVVFVEYRGEDPEVPIKRLHKMTEAQVKKEMAVHPELEWVETKKELPQQHMIFFRKKWREWRGSNPPQNQ